MAQVAISAISLTRLEDAHWTAQAFFVASLTTGSLSVFFSCALNPAFHGLHSSEDIKDFLTKPTPAYQRSDFRKSVSNFIKEIGPDFRRADQQTYEDVTNYLTQGRWKVPSANAAIMLVAPMMLLRVALNAFLIGLGIYLGKLYTAELLPAYGKGAIGILTFYIVSAVLGLSVYYISEALKLREDAPLKAWRKVLDDYRAHQREADTDDLKKEKDIANKMFRTPATRFFGRKQKESPISPTEDDLAQDTKRSATKGGFVQSRHLRDGNKTSYTTTEPDVPAKDALADDEISFAAQKQAWDALPFTSSDAAQSSQPNTQAVLEILLRAQKESVQATERLLTLHKRSISDQSRLGF